MAIDAGIDPRPLRFLQSYPYLRRAEKEMDLALAMADVTDVMIDCGAFTVYQQRRKAAAAGVPQPPPITVEEYILACKQWHGRVWGYIQLDEIRDPPGTRRNLARMLDAGLLPMPVFVMGEEYERVADLVAINRRICVAGGQRGTTAIHARYQKAFKASGDRALIHSLGFVRFPSIYRLPIASGDSSTFSSGSRFGSTMYYDPRKGLRAVHYRSILDGDRKAANYEQVFGMTRRCNIRPDQFRDRARMIGSRGIPSMMSSFATFQFARDAAARGFRLFVAQTGGLWIVLLVALASARNGPTSFDYPTAWARSNELMALWKEDANRCIDRVQRLLAEVP